MSTQSGSHKRHDFTPLPPVVSRKRKDRDVFDAQRAPVTTKPEPAPPATAHRLQGRQQPIKPVGGGGNRLLAGYLAHEFLTKGTLFGQRWDPAAAASKPLAPACHQPEAKELLPKQQPQMQQLTQVKPQVMQQRQMRPTPPEAKQGRPPPAYAEVAYLMKTDGAHVPGIVNPTQLARWLQM